MKCVRCGNETTNKNSFCDNCQNYITKGRNKIEKEEINWGYMLVSISVIAVAIMIAMIAFCTK